MLVQSFRRVKSRRWRNCTQSASPSCWGGRLFKHKEQDDSWKYLISVYKGEVMPYYLTAFYSKTTGSQDERGARGGVYLEFSKAFPAGHLSSITF